MFYTSRGATKSVFIYNTASMHFFSVTVFTRTYCDLKEVSRCAVWVVYRHLCVRQLSIQAYADNIYIFLLVSLFGQMPAVFPRTYGTVEVCLALVSYYNNIHHMLMLERMVFLSSCKMFVNHSKSLHLNCTFQTKCSYM